MAAGDKQCCFQVTTAWSCQQIFCSVLRGCCRVTFCTDVLLSSAWWFAGVAGADNSSQLANPQVFLNPSNELHIDTTAPGNWPTKAWLMYITCTELSFYPSSEHIPLALPGGRAGAQGVGACPQRYWDLDPGRTVH